MFKIINDDKEEIRVNGGLLDKDTYIFSPVTEFSDNFIGENHSIWIAFRIDEKHKHWIDYFESLGETWDEAVISTAIVLGISVRRSG